MKLLLLSVLILNFSCVNQNKCGISETLKQKAEQELNTVLEKGQKFVKVHAAEFLLWLEKDKQRVYNIFQKENEQFGSEPKYRIGIWRVLAQSANNENEKQQWIEKVMNVFTDTTAPDRIHAAETLAKLKVSPMIEYADITNKTLNDTNNILSVYTKWATSYTSKEMGEENKSAFIDYLFNSSDTIIRKISAYVLLKSKQLTADEWETIADRALAEPENSGLKQTLLNTAYVTFEGNNVKKKDAVTHSLLTGYQKLNAEQRIALCQSLAANGTCSDLPIAESFLNNENVSGLYDVTSSLGADVRAFAAYAILNISEKNN